jgi:DNA-binding MarR family transcriptional regulator
MERSNAERAAWNAFRRAAGALIARVDVDLQTNLDVGYTDVDALLQLTNADGGCLRMASLARAVDRSPSASTRLVDRLEARALVGRERRSATDVRVEVTDEGRALLAEAAPRIVEQVAAHFWSKLTAQELETLTAICAKLTEVDPSVC